MSVDQAPRLIDEVLFAGCVGCGCNDGAACEGGCSWVVPYALCSRCADDVDAAIDLWVRRAARAVAELRAIDKQLTAAEAEALDAALVAAFAAAVTEGRGA
jgi:hypothetical protein